jgi:hypothetical protein
VQTPKKFHLRRRREFDRGWPKNHCSRDRDAPKNQSRAAERPARLDTMFATTTAAMKTKTNVEIIANLQIRHFIAQARRPGSNEQRSCDQLCRAFDSNGVGDFLAATGAELGRHRTPCPTQRIFALRFADKISLGRFFPPQIPAGVKARHDQGKNCEEDEPD